jgi:hypothetical protein
VLAACGAVVSASLVTGADRSVAVLALARPVAAGHVVTISDLRVAHVSGTGLSALAASAEGSTVGTTAVASLPAGTLLVPGMVAEAPAPATGSQLVAVAVKAGLAPPQVAAGRAVSLIAVTTAAGDGPSHQPTVLVGSARVIGVSMDATSGDTDLSVMVPDRSAPAVAQASADGGVAVSVLPVGS